jgi:hypothetical protein
MTGHHEHCGCGDCKQARRAAQEDNRVVFELYGYRFSSEPIDDEATRKRLMNTLCDAFHHPQPFKVL